MRGFDWFVCLSRVAVEILLRTHACVVTFKTLKLPTRFCTSGAWDLALQLRQAFRCTIDSASYVSALGALLPLYPLVNPCIENDV